MYRQLCDHWSQSHVLCVLVKLCQWWPSLHHAEVESDSSVYASTFCQGFVLFFFPATDGCSLGILFQPVLCRSVPLSLSPCLFLFSFFSPHLLLVPRPTHLSFSHYCFFPSVLAFCVTQTQGLCGGACSASGTGCRTGWGTLPPLLLVACQVPRAGSGVLKMINIYPDCFYQTLYLMVCFII